MFNNFRIKRISEYGVERKDKGDCLAIYDTDTLRDDKELFIKVLNYRHLPYTYFNGANTDKLFIAVHLTTYKRRQSFLKMLKKFKGHTLTKSEKKQLYNIRKGYYISKKYMDETVTDAEYGIYEPVNNYSDYWDNNDCSEWDKLNKGIKYEKKLIWEAVSELSPYKRMMYGEK